MNRQTDGLKDTLKLIFETSLLPKYYIFKSKMLKEEITLELKMQFHKKNSALFDLSQTMLYLPCLSLFVAKAINIFSK
jgi:hypothetical protein